MKIPGSDAIWTLGKLSLLPIMIMRRSSVSSMQKPMRDNIETVLKFLHSKGPGQPTTSAEPPAKKTKQEEAKKKDESVAKKQKKCSFCLAKRDRKTKFTCSMCHHYICQEHAVLLCKICTH
ncbi:hypothetical protein PoB_000562300 [Plakobranchus ocellatus]|uniref:PiggyBac transposable element-derived protein 4 C-terminal zinc-ribbon domain-containing protein n=1 Tax=Plakobranchus ocellatus TaxID=259542 RepID=A0AAV3YAE8_9GAST|nr:hypothetical protein PoB_000562300 [Plakobranchus ocellatus]